ncbi:r2r3-MYB transcription factor [Tritrichomonas foetus]|uniref:R2r3-MYB transcription factor n=1 Tax=Tritrichomonas foetus TaxID=1144522 RepID=A0A1J4JKF4_9EUKA|nr:r2r3-MYB transcription factor [Tritrichomonas foetus]|eukprot:OHS99610.1 r2r3-MYB transcription factor [Tritrichomonas foetus]
MTKDQKKHRKLMFTKQEDEQLRKLVNEFGETDWDLVASYMEGRTRRQCRERWRKFLSPHLNNSPWTQEEDRLLLERYETFGPKWVTISRSFKNRTDINVKSRFLVLQRQQRKNFEESLKNDKSSISNKSKTRSLFISKPTSNDKQPDFSPSQIAIDDNFSYSDFDPMQLSIWSSFQDSPNLINSNDPRNIELLPTMEKNIHSSQKQSSVRELEQDDNYCLETMLQPLKDLETQMQMNLWTPDSHPEAEFVYMSICNMVF